MLRVCNPAYRRTIDYASVCTRLEERVVRAGDLCFTTLREIQGFEDRTLSNESRLYVAYLDGILTKTILAVRLEEEHVERVNGAGRILAPILERYQPCGFKRLVGLLTFAERHIQNGLDPAVLVRLALRPRPMPILDEYLDDTNGYIVFREQLAAVCHLASGDVNLWRHLYKLRGMDEVLYQATAASYAIQERSLKIILKERLYHCTEANVKGVRRLHNL